MTVNHTRAEVCKQEAGAREEDEVEREGTQSVVQKDMLKSEEEEGLKAKERRKGNVRLGHNTCLHLRGSKVQLVKSFHSLHSPPTSVSAPHSEYRKSKEISKIQVAKEVCVYVCVCRFYCVSKCCPM